MKKQAVVTCFLKHGDKIMIFQRSNKVKTYKGKWAGVSGYLEDMENPFDRAEREVAEETGLIPPDVALIRQGRPISVEDGKNHWLVHPFLFEVRSPHRVKLDWEHSKAEWVFPKDLSQYNCIPGLYDAYQRVELPEVIIKKIETIRTDKTSGAVELATAALDTLLLAGKIIPAQSAEEFFEGLFNIGWHLIRVRPTMAPIESEIATILTQIKEKFKSTSSAQVLYHALQLQINQLRRERELAKASLLNHSLKILNKYSTIMTHSYSASVITLLTKWAKSDSHIIITESRPLYEGHTALRLLSRVCRITLITEAQIGYIMPEVDAVVVGADSILADGSVMNKTGTYLMALAAKDHKKQFYVAADTSKFHLGSALGMDIPIEKHDAGEVYTEQISRVSISNVYFDRTPSRLITGVFTEEGLINGSALRNAVHKKGKLLKDFGDMGNYFANKGKS